MKKLISLMICLLLIVTMTIPAFATEAEGTAATGSQTEPAATEPVAPPTQETEIPDKETEGPGNETQAPSTEPEGTDKETEAPDKETEGEGHNHVWGEGIVTTQPTCTTDGLKTYTCSCGNTATEVIAATGHVYDNACDPECNTCKATREIQHKVTTGWKRNWEEHWHECSICKAKLDTGDHFPGPAATEEQDQLCLTCSLVMTPKKSHQHTYGTKLTSDETGHWYACESCGERKDFAYHEYDDLCDPDCNVCGFATPTAHSFDETWRFDESGHWSLCVLCDEKTEVEAHTADPNPPETEALLCAVCGYELAPAPEHVHEAASQWDRDEENHWKTCQCGEALEKAPHSWDAGTENEDTTVTYRCTGCAAEKTEGEPKVPSAFPLTTVLTVLLAAFAALAVILSLILRRGKKSAGRFTKK